MFRNSKYYTVNFIWPEGGDLYRKPVYTSSASAASLLCEAFEPVAEEYMWSTRQMFSSDLFSSYSGSSHSVLFTMNFRHTWFTSGHLDDVDFLLKQTWYVLWEWCLPHTHQTIFKQWMMLENLQYRKSHSAVGIFHICIHKVKKLRSSHQTLKR